ncbi:HesA/MoeB/ThiF family protein [Pelagibacteraceae bacterium]|jgi:molybdopterin-synthase adenylyltransferase|nr:HesA/MoeB/ThiF family protein [Pelagibacteraceae bacterium]MDC1130615.1 HesA/MoeB/ThiF family protein [Pelagibacteraceae bacterium]
MELNFKDFKRFEKQIILKKIGISGQKRIKNSKVLIVGMGGLGCPLLTYLASAGVGNIGIVDHDKVELSNLNRQTLFNLSDIGKFKVVQAKIKISKILKSIKIKTFKEKLLKKNVKKIFKDYEIICDGTDNFDTRFLINDECKKSKKILISAAISKFNGQLFKFNFKKKTSCFRCFMPIKPDHEFNCGSEGIFSPIAGILGSLQANEVLKSILKLNNELNNSVLIFDSLKTTLRKVKITSNINCYNKCKK